MNNKKRKPFAVMTSAALAISLLMSPASAGVLAAGTGTTVTTTNATTTAPAVKISFPDVPTTHWAKSHISKLAAAGIVRGYVTGNFSPNNDVTQQEAIVMVIRMIGLEEEALAGSGDVVTGFREDAFFTKYVVKALEEKIIDLAEETMAAAADDSPWGSRPATREWISKLVIRAIGEAPATGALTFADANQITPIMAGYVAKAQSLQLIAGFTDNTFKPKDPVTRAQIATILSRADKYIPDDPAKYVSGYIVNRSAAALELQTTAGTLRTLTINPETLVFDEEGNALSLTELTSLTTVRVIQQNDQAYYIEVSDQSVQMESIEGELLAYNPGDRTVVVERTDGAMELFNLSANATISNAQGGAITMAQLKEGSDIRLQRIQGASEVISIVVTREAYNASGIAVAEDVNLQKREVTFNDATGATVKYPVSEGAVITVKGEAASGLASLQFGDTFTYEIRDSVITAIDITVQKFVTVSGTFQVHAGNTITILEKGIEPKAFFLRNNARVNIDGLTNPSLDDLQVGDTVELRISGESNQVDQVTVTNRNVVELRAVTIEDLHKDYLTIRDDKGLPQLFYITNRTEFRIDGEPLTEQLFSMYLTKGRKVNLNVTANQLVRLDIVTKVSGTITAMNPTSRTITVKPDQGESVTLNYSLSTFVEVPLQTSSGLSDLTVGAKAHFLMGMSSDEVTSIQLEKSFVYNLTAVAESTRTIHITNPQGVTTTLFLGTSVSVKNRNGQNVALGNLPVGKPILVHYAGRTVVSVQEAVTTLGIVTMLDITGGKMTITDYNNNSRTFDLTKGIVIQQGNTVSNNPSSLKLNDRVQLVVDAQGIPYVKIATVEVRKFSSYDAAKNELALKILKLGDQNKFVLDSSVQMRTSAGGLLALNRLKENDTLTVYFLDGRIIEIVQ